MTTENTTKPNGDHKTRQKNTPNKNCIRKKKKTETKKFLQKRSETHLIFSKTHNPLPFTLTTSENLTKPNGDTKTRQKHPKQEQDQTQKRKKTPKAIDPPQKSP